MRSLAGALGSRPKSTLPTSFSYGPAFPKEAPLRTTSRRSIRNRTTRASAVAAASKPATIETMTTRIIGLACGALLRDCPGRQRLGSRVGVRNVPAHLVHEPRDLFHLHVVDLLGPIVLRVIVRMETGDETHRRDAALENRPLVAAPHQVRAVVVVALFHVESDPAVGLLDDSRHVGNLRKRHQVQGVAVRLRRLRLEAVEPLPAADRDLLVAANHVHVEYGGNRAQRLQRLLGVGPRAKQAALFGIPGREEHAALGALTVFR